jgi:thymidine kinase
MVDNLVEQLDTQQFRVSDTIFIEEGQFFTDLYEFVKEAVETFHKEVIVIGLDGDSERNNFGEIYRLYPFADDITKLKALCVSCNDGTAGIFSKKVVDSGGQVDIGSSDKYIAVCRNCYLK